MANPVILSTGDCDTTQTKLPELLSIWPILERVARELAAGDLIRLARTNSLLRSVLHHGHPRARSGPPSTTNTAIIPLVPPIGQHQTTFWRHVKSKSRFTCSSTSHTRGDKVRTCLYCSLPICEACIVRDSFQRRHENTFRNRFRYLCPECWSEGRPVKSFRYNKRNSEEGTPVAGKSNTDESLVDAIGDTCSCTIKDHGWLCLDCKRIQNSSPLAFSNYQGEETRDKDIECYGYMCDKLISLADPDKDRRRICLWCERSLRKQYGSEDCSRSHVRFYDLCARNAAERTLRIQNEIVSQKQDLTVDGLTNHCNGKPSSDKIKLLPHLDAVNYRNFLENADCPQPESVWRSKMGIWQYDVNFLFSIGRYYSQGKDISTRVLGLEKAQEVTNITTANALPGARTNEVLSRRWFITILSPEDYTHEIYASRVLELLKTRILSVHLGAGLEATRENVRMLQDIIRTQYGIDIGLQMLQNHVLIWRKTHGSTSTLLHTSANAMIGAVSTMEVMPETVNSRSTSDLVLQCQDLDTGDAKSLYDGDTLADVDNHSDDDDLFKVPLYKAQSNEEEYMSETDEERSTTSTITREPAERDDIDADGKVLGSSQT